mgnify:CR=1 FL=1
MKKKVLPLAIISLLFGSTSTILAQKVDQKSENAREDLRTAKTDLIKAKEDLKEAQIDSIMEYEKFKKESNDNIADHEKNMSDFNERIKKDKKINREKYEKRLADLKLKNSDLKKRLNDYKYDTQFQWSIFKIKFLHDMDTLGKQIKDLLNEK